MSDMLGSLDNAPDADERGACVGILLGLVVMAGVALAGVVKRGL